MNYTMKSKVHEICENVRDEYLLNALEENTNVSEVDVLRMKKFLNENISRIEKMLVEEGYVEYGRQIIEESFKTVAKNVGLAGAGALAGAAGLEAAQHPEAIQQAITNAGEHIKGAWDHLTSQVNNQTPAPTANNNGPLIPGYDDNPVKPTTSSAAPTVSTTVNNDRPLIPGYDDNPVKPTTSSAAPTVNKKGPLIPGYDDV